MSPYGLPILYTLFVWWFSTGLILYLDGLPRPTFRWSMAGASAVLAGALYGLAASSADAWLCEAIARWPSLEDELGATFAYRQGGNLYNGEGEGEIEAVKQFVKRQQANGFEDVRFVDRKGAL